MNRDQSFEYRACKNYLESQGIFLLFMALIPDLVYGGGEYALLVHVEDEVYNI